MTKRFEWKTAGKARPENVIKSGKCRITLLTSRLVRFEYDEGEKFEDRATQRFFYRDLPPVGHVVSEKKGYLEIETDNLTVYYKKGTAFAEDTLRVTLKDAPFTTWRYGHTASQLKGTAETLDGANGAIELQDGVCSRSGYTVVDDSDGMVLTKGWIDLRREETDLYFFGYGHDYLSCIKDLYRVTGRPPLLPDYALGNWWSRFYKYSEKEYSELIERFEKEDIPFSVAVVDMDWHPREQSPEGTFPAKRYQPGWTGYSWDRELFPDYKRFLKFLEKHNLKTALNLHPAQGVGPFEDMYEEMAKACGIDPKTEKTVKFDLLSPDFMEKYFDILHHPYEKDGVDFWWMDWQQGKDYWWIHDDEHPENRLEKMDPLWMLNHLHILDISRNGKRPMFFSRYCGLGAHRYPVGFSGDTVTTWESLDFQPYFTANATNAGYGWWSHDIGGHMRGYRSDRMTVRWIQLGVFSPVNRLHSSNNLFSGKEPWNLAPYENSVAKDYLRLRHRLFPYIYTMNMRCNKDLVPLVLPMYYTHPEEEEAYNVPNQYWFGSELMVSPVTRDDDPVTLHGRAEVWFPEGKWIDAFRGLVYTGNRKTYVYRRLDEMPVFAKAGAIVPMQCHSHDNLLGRKKDMEVYVFAGDSNRFELYEDAGDGDGYKKGESATTVMELDYKEKACRFTIKAKGDLALLPGKRTWNIKFRGFSDGCAATVTVGGKKVKNEQSYDKKSHTVCVTVSAPTAEKVEVKLSADRLMHDNGDNMEFIRDLILHAQTDYIEKAELYNCALENMVKRIDIFHSGEQYKDLTAAVKELLDLRKE